MTNLCDNPMGLDGFEFVEFAAAERGALEAVFETMGFQHVARHRSKAVGLWRLAKSRYEQNKPHTSHARKKN